MACYKAAHTAAAEPSGPITTNNVCKQLTPQLAVYLAPLFLLYDLCYLAINLFQRSIVLEYLFLCLQT